MPQWIPCSYCQRLNEAPGPVSGRCEHCNKWTPPPVWSAYITHMRELHNVEPVPAQCPLCGNFQAKLPYDLSKTKVTACGVCFGSVIGEDWQAPGAKTSGMKTLTPDTPSLVITIGDILAEFNQPRLDVIS